MAKLYYGEDKRLGFCNIEGSDIRGIEIRYRGSIEIEKKTPDSFVTLHQKNGIVKMKIYTEVISRILLMVKKDWTSEIRK